MDNAGHAARGQPKLQLDSTQTTSEMKQTSEENWLHAMRAAGTGTKCADMATIRSLRVAVQEETVSVVNTDPFLNSVCKPTISHRAGHAGFKQYSCVDETKTLPTVRVVQGDCLEQAQILLASGYKQVAVLNMANPQTPGGGWRHGAGAQEENLHRRSTLFRSLQQAGQLYPIPEDGVLYSPAVTVFRGPEDEGYPFLKTPFTVAIISCAAQQRPHLVRSQKGGPPHLSPQSVAQLERKILAILEVADAQGQEALVLSALGCGAFHNPPEHVASIFKQTFTEFFRGNGETSIGSGSIKTVVFAIFDDHNARCKCGHNPRGNLIPFQETFESNNLAH